MPTRDCESDHSRLSTFIRSNRIDLLNRWTKHLISENLGPVNEIARSTPLGIESDQNLLSVMQRIAERNGVVIPEDGEFHLAHVRQKDYSIAELSAEITALERAFISQLGQDERGPQFPDEIIDVVRNSLSRVFIEIVDQVAAVFRDVIATEHQPLCLLNPNGQILYANMAMTELLGRSSLTGVHLADCVVSSDRKVVEESLEAQQAQEPCQKEIDLLRPDGTKLRVTAHIHPRDILNSGIGAYATFIDNSYIIAREQKFFDRLNLAAIKLDRNLRVTYANQAAAELLCTPTEIRGLSIYDIFRRSATTTQQFEKRRAGEADVYEAEIICRSDGKRIPVSVAGTPILDDHQEFIGSLGIVRSLEREKSADAIHRLIDSKHDDRELLAGVANQLKPIIPFDYFGVAELSRDGNHVATWFSYASGKSINAARRWWPIDFGRKPEYERPVITSDFASFIHERRPEAGDEPDIKSFLSQHFESMMRFPIYEQGRVAASVILLSKQKDVYNDACLRILLDLPVAQAVQMAMFYRRQKNSLFRYELFKGMVRCSNAKDLARLLAEMVAEHWAWQHITVFKVNESDRMFKLLAEVGTNGIEALPPESREQPLSSGILGRVYKSGLAVNIANLAANPLYDKPVSGSDGVRSELCLPIVWDDKVQWLLNVEDEQAAAFSKDDEEDLGIILEEAALIVSRISTQYLLESALQSSSDSVFVTDNQAEIVLGNPAAVKLLGYESPTDLKGPFERIFRDKHAARRIFETTGSAGGEVDLLRKDETTVPVLISGSDLPEDLSRKVFVAKDLTLVRRVRQLETLRKLFQEVALQTHTPLALVETWIKNLGEREERDDLSGFCTKVLGQLKKMEISFDRLALCVTHENVLNQTEKQPLDLGAEIKRTIREFPASEAARIDFSDPGDLAYIPIDPAQLSFVLSSILAYLIRFAKPDVSVKIRFPRESGTIKVTFSALIPDEPEPRAGDWPLSRARFELALGESTISAFVENNGAKYRRETTLGETVIELAFPVAEGAA